MERTSSEVILKSVTYVLSIPSFSYYFDGVEPKLNYAYDHKQDWYVRHLFDFRGELESGTWVSTKTVLSDWFLESEKVK